MNLDDVLMVVLLPAFWFLGLLTLEGAIRLGMRLWQLRSPLWQPFSSATPVGQNNLKKSDRSQSLWIYLSSLPRKNW